MRARIRTRLTLIPPPKTPCWCGNKLGKLLFISRSLAHREAIRGTRGSVKCSKNPSLRLVWSRLAVSTAALHAQDTKPAVDKDSQKFITNAIQGDIAEVDIGQLAQQKGKSQAVKEYGAMLVKDHGDHRDKAAQIATQLDVKPPTGSSVTQKATYLKLKVLSGDTFDRSFAETMVADHKADIKMYQAESGKSDASGTLAKETLPILQHHLEVAQSLVRETATTGRAPKQ